VMHGNIGIGDDTPIVQGAYVEGTWFPWVSALGPRTGVEPGSEDDRARVLRVGLVGQVGPAFMVTDALKIGVSASLGVAFELAAWLGPTPFQANNLDDPPDEDGKKGKPSGIFGVAYGEGGVGVSLSAGYTDIVDHRAWQLTVNFTFRLPASAGVFWKAL